MFFHDFFMKNHDFHLKYGSRLIFHMSWPISTKKFREKKFFFSEKKVKIFSCNSEKIRIATASDEADDILGVISETAGFVGNSGNFRWQGKYVKDDFGKVITIQENRVSWLEEQDGGQQLESDYKVGAVPEDVTITEDADYHTITTEKINPDFDDTQEYIKRDKRKEWTVVGLIGQVAIKKTAPKKPSWIKLREVSNTVEQWLVR